MPFASLEELKAAVEKHEKKDDIVDYVVSAVEAEKQRGITEKRRANKEAEGLRAYKKAFEGLGFDASSAESTLESFVEELQTTRTKAEQNGGKSEEVLKQLKKLQKDFDKTKEELAAEKKASTELKTKADRKTIKAKLSDALRDRVYGHDLLADSLISNGKVALEAETDSVVFIDGDDTVEFDKGIQALLEQRTDILKNTQKSGARSSAKTTEAGTRYTEAQIRSMTADEIAADLENVRESMRTANK